MDVYIGGYGRGPRGQCPPCEAFNAGNPPTEKRKRLGRTAALREYVA